MFTKEDIENLIITGETTVAGSVYQLQNSGGKWQVVDLDEDWVIGEGSNPAEAVTNATNYK